MENINIEKQEIADLFNKLELINKKRNYYFNFDKTFTCGILEGLLVNQKRYGYMTCPCRVATKKKENDLDIICPCDYRDADVSQYGNCFCGLYISKEKSNNKIPTSPIPERRPNNKMLINKNMQEENTKEKKELPMWRCSVCGYLCARENAPDVCPICGAEKDRFVKTEETVSE